MTYTFQFRLGMDRRTFLKLLTLFSASLITGCSKMIYVPPDLRTVAQGFQPYNGRNPNVLGKQYQTFLDNIHEHKVAWAGAQYRRNLSEPIVASARGKVDLVRTHNGYHGLEDDVRIDHGGAFKTRYFHMKPKASNVVQGQIVERGENIGHTKFGMPFKTSMHYRGKLGDMDDYGYGMSYMEYWDGRQVDDNFSVVENKSKRHIGLIDELRKKYIGPGSEQFQKTIRGIPTILKHDPDDYYTWSYAMFFRLLKQIYVNHPELYLGTKSENDTLIKEIYDTQPVILTLMFKP